MGFRFRKSFKVMPGVRINLSKSGVSSSVGMPGATVNLGKRGLKGTTGIPGSGLSYQSRIGAPESDIDASVPSVADEKTQRALEVMAVIGGIIKIIFSLIIGIVTVLGVISMAILSAALSAANRRR